MMLLVEDRGGWEIKLFASNDLLSLNLHTAFYFSLCKEQCPWRCTHFEPLLGSKPFSECCDALWHFFITDILYLFLNPPVHVTPLSISMEGTLTKLRAKLEISAHVESLDSLYLSRVRVPRCLRPTDLSPCAATASPLLRATYEMAALSPPLWSHFAHYFHQFSTSLLAVVPQSNCFSQNTAST